MAEVTGVGVVKPSRQVVGKLTLRLRTSRYRRGSVEMPVHALVLGSEHSRGDTFGTEGLYGSFTDMCRQNSGSQLSNTRQPMQLRHGWDDALALSQIIRGAYKRGQ
jgi:hypothetical protein